MIELQQVKLENFLSYARASVDLTQQGPVLVVGQNLDSRSADSNGSGKSAIFEALVWCLFGQTLRGLTQSEVVRGYPDPVSEGCRVEVTFDLETGDQTAHYSIVRSQKKSGKLDILLDGQSLPLKDKREAEAKVEELLGVDYSLFTQSIILGQDALVFAGATDAEKKRILEGVAGIAEFVEYEERAKKEMQALEQAIIQEERQLEFIETTISIESERIEELDRCSRTWNSTRTDQLNQLKVEKDQLQLQISSRDEFRDLQTQRDKLRQTIKDGQTELVHPTSEKVKATQEHRDIKDVCPTCERPFDEVSIKTARANAQKRIEEAELQISQINQKLEPLSAKAEVADASLNARCEELGVDTLDELDQLDASIVRVTTQIEEKEKETDRYQEERSNRQTKLADAEALKTATLIQIGDLKEDAEYDGFWVTGFGKKGVRSYVLDRVANYLNERATEYSVFLTDGEIEVRFTTQRPLKSGDVREDFNVQGLNRSGADIYKGNSAGERQRVDVCVALALQDLIRSRTGVGVNLFVCDEAAANLDAEGSERMLRLLRHLTTQGRKVFYVTHDSTVQDLFPAQLRVIKEQGVSRIE